MLNRRILRSKVMQALYGYKQAENSDYEMALDKIQETFSDLEAQKAEGYRQLAVLLFQESYKADKVLKNEMPDEVFKATISAINFYRDRLREDKRVSEKHLSVSLDKIYTEYLLILALLTATGEIAQKMSEEKTKLTDNIITSQDEAILNTNRIVEILRKHGELAVLSIRNGISWEKESALVKRFFREVVRPDAVFQEYLQKTKTDFEEDRQLIDHIIRKLIFKQDLMTEFFEEYDLYWGENQEIVRSMVLKTLKSIDPDGTLELSEMSKSWEEDKEFYKDLFNFTLEEDPKQEEVIAEKIKNWDIERVSLTDQIILKMAVAEMIHFPSIPVKVSINEYIELAKTYSTPKSKQFINGTLDALSQDLIAQKVIRKSGRGLLDNK